MSHKTKDFLSHYGVKGMSWGVRKSSRPKPGTKEGRSRDHKIDNARERINSGANRQRYQKARTNYKHDKISKGRKEAKRTLNRTKLKNLNDARLASSAKDGKEFASMVMLDVLTGGAVTIANLSQKTYAKRLEKKIAKKK